MTNKNSNKGQFAPKSKHPVVVEAEKSSNLIGAVIMSAIWFATIFVAAIGLGFLIHWTAANCDWFPHWMIVVGHVVEAVLFAADTICFLWSVGTHLIHTIRGKKK